MKYDTSTPEEFFFSSYKQSLLVNYGYKVETLLTVNKQEDSRKRNRAKALNHITSMFTSLVREMPPSDGTIGTLCMATMKLVKQ